MLSFLGFELDKFVIGTSSKISRVAIVDGQSILFLGDEFLIVLSLLKHEPRLFLEQVVVLDSCLVEDLKFRFDLVLDLQLSFIQFFLQQFRRVLSENVLVDLVGL